MITLQCILNQLIVMTSCPSHLALGYIAVIFGWARNKLKNIFVELVLLSFTWTRWLAISFVRTSRALSVWTCKPHLRTRQKSWIQWVQFWNRTKAMLWSSIIDTLAYWASYSSAASSTLMLLEYCLRQYSKRALAWIRKCCTSWRFLHRRKCLDTWPQRDPDQLPVLQIKFFPRPWSPMLHRLWCLFTTLQQATSPIIWGKFWMIITVLALYRWFFL